MTAKRQLIQGGAVISADPEIGNLAKGDVLIEGSRIVAVGEGLEAGDAEVVEATGTIVMPGFVDTHRHTWQAPWRTLASDWTLAHYMTGLHLRVNPRTAPEHLRAANTLGALEALDSGITTLLDWSHNLNSPEHADAAVEALRGTGMRVVFAHGGGAREWAVPSDAAHTDDARRVRSEHFSSDDGLVTMAMALRGPQFTTSEASEADFALANELDLPITMHVGDGEWGKSRPLFWLQERDLLGPRITYVHCNTIGDDELRLIADSGGTASVAPDVEMQMGHGWPATGRLLDVGIRPSFSIDVCSSNGGDMFGTMRSAVGVQRAIDNDVAERAGEPLELLKVTCQDAIEFATIEGARACGLDDRTGSLTPGKEADLIMVRHDTLSMSPLNNPAGAIVYAAHPGNVDSVFVAGRCLKRAGKLIDVDEARVIADATRARDELNEAAGIQIGGGWIPEPTHVPEEAHSS
jgi:5-methylthioadenosine/S-adenosylhomocysteine deaminase